MKLPKPGDVVAIDFDDHSQSDGEDSIFPATAYGKVIKVESDRIVIDAWHATDPEVLRKPGDNALVTFAIVRKAITGIHRVDSWETL